MTFLCWPLESMTDIISLRVQQTKLQCETKTLDNVFVDVSIVVQYQVMKMYAFDAHYKLDNSVKQIEADVFDKVRVDGLHQARPLFSLCLDAKTARQDLCLTNLVH